MIIEQPVAITLRAHEWLQIAGHLAGQPVTLEATRHLLACIDEAMLKDGR